MEAVAFDPAVFVVAGNATFTISPTPAAIAHFMGKGQDCLDHYTYKVHRKEGMWQGKPSVTWFVSLLTGPDNWSNYTYMGLLNHEAMSLRLTAKSKYTSDSVPVAVLRRLFKALAPGYDGPPLPEGYVYHAGKCGRCGRKLTVPSSIENGIGPECMKKVYGG